MSVDILTFILTFLCMASLWHHPKSPYWTACYTDETGRQCKRSTKIPIAKSGGRTAAQNRSAAQAIADSFEQSAQRARQSELIRATATKVLSELMERTVGEGIDNRSVRTYFAHYQAGLMARGTTEGTLARYKPIFSGFLAHIGEARSNARLASVTAQELESFRDAELSAGKSKGTAGFAMKVLSGVFEDARRKAVILHNPVSAVTSLSDTAGEERQPFNDEQVKALLAVADVEWQGMILFGYHTGARLTDIANLTRTNIEGNVLRFRDKKTSHRKQRASERETKVVMASDLLNYLKSLPIPMNKNAPLFPSLFGKKPGSAGGLSNTFARLMDSAGIDRKQGDRKKGKGRTFNALSFHSLRHTLISRLAKSNASEAVAKAITSHSTDEAHARYVHLDVSAQEKVIAKAPRLWKKTAVA